MFTFNHFNFNVFDLERSLKFYDEALGLKPVREKDAADGSFRIVFLDSSIFAAVPIRNISNAQSTANKPCFRCFFRAIFD